ncbi:hypothetical protein AB0O01_24765 [Streptomyces sp. NPDC093252]|uniref:hypothetical protein n=1 Tax=Streptomyces sp. NPDC093252 TaxID=3154980 RepID=UPI00344091A2
MAHAAPAPGPARAPGTTPGTGTGTGTRLPDVLSARTHRIALWAVPAGTGLIYGYWVAANNRSGGPITGWNVLLGFVAALAFAALSYALLRTAPKLRREVHAVLWAAFGGCAFGFLYSEAGASILRSVFMSLAVAAVVFVVLFYRYYTHEDAEGHRVS